MFDFQQKNKIRKFFYSRPVVAIVLVIAIYALYSTWSIYEKMVQSHQILVESQQQLLALSAKGVQLDGQISELQTQDGKEREIRSKFGEAKPGESMAVIVSDTDSSSTATSTSQSMWHRFLHFFGL
jgi:cell division protein FtsB